MRMFLISDNVDTLTGMRLAGIEGVVVHEKQEIKQALDEVLSQKDIGIILMTEKLGKEIPEILFDGDHETVRFLCCWKFLTATVQAVVRISLQHILMKLSE